jgi:hypothetical protein
VLAKLLVDLELGRISPFVSSMSFMFDTV